MLTSRISKLIHISAVVCTFAICPIVNATLIGETISADGMMLSPTSATIGSGVEFTGINNYMSFDFGDDSLTLTTSGVGFANWGNYVFSGFSSIITGVSIQSTLGFWEGSLFNPIVFTQDSITLDMTFGNAISYDPNNNYQKLDAAVLVFKIETAPSTPSTVPDVSGTLSLLGFTLVGFFALRRKLGLV